MNFQEKLFKYTIILIVPNKQTKNPLRNTVNQVGERSV